MDMQQLTRDDIINAFAIVGGHYVADGLPSLKHSCPSRAAASWAISM